MEESEERRDEKGKRKELGERSYKERGEVKRGRRELGEEK